MKIDEPQTPNTFHAIFIKYFHQNVCLTGYKEKKLCYPQLVFIFHRWTILVDGQKWGPKSSTHRTTFFGPGTCSSM